MKGLRRGEKRARLVALPIVPWALTSVYDENIGELQEKYCKRGKRKLNGPYWKEKDWKSIDLFSLYVLFSHFRPRDDVTPQITVSFKSRPMHVLPRPLYTYRVFSLTWPASMQIYWNKRKRLHKKSVQLPEDWFGTPTWPPFHCFGTPIWPLWRHVKTLYSMTKQKWKFPGENDVVWTEMTKRKS